MPASSKRQTAKKSLGLRSKIQSRRARTNFIAMSRSKKVTSSPAVKQLTDKVIEVLDSECGGAAANSGSNMYSRVCKTIGVDKSTVTTIVYTTLGLLTAGTSLMLGRPGQSLGTVHEEPLGDVVACDQQGVCHFGPKWQGQGLFDGGARRKTRRSRKY
jgi:hypothetical protein